MLLRRTGWLGLAVALGMLGGSALLAPAGAAVTAGTVRTAGTAGLAGRPDRANVGAAHSPRLLRQLAGRADAGGPAGSAHPSRSAIAGAVQGVDVASFQHPGGAAINWPDAAADGIGFAAVKGTEGTYYRNPYALTDLAQARAAGLAVGAYAFAIPDGNGGSKRATAQADYLLSYLGAASGKVPVMLDIEYDPYVSSDGTNQCYGLSRAAMVSWVASFDAEIQRKTGRLPIIYTPPSWWNTCAGGSARFRHIPLWVPAYTTAASPGLPDGWGNWAIWQYTSSGTVTGIDTAGHTDLDQLNPGLLALLNPGQQRHTAGRPADFRLRPAVALPGQALSFSARGLPAGILVSARGRITGWADRPGTYPVRVTATDGHGTVGSVSFTWTVTRAPTGVPADRVRLRAGGRCLRDAGNGRASGTPVNIGRCNGSTAERWKLVQDDTLRIHRKCLTVPGMASGARAELRSCTGGAAQQWRAGSRGVLINPASGQCLAGPGGSTGNGTRVRLRPCTGSAAQQWTLPDGPVASQLPGRCLADRRNATASGTPVVLSSCDLGAAQLWRPRPDGTLRIHGKCLAVSGRDAASRMPVDLRACRGGRAQWRMVADGAGVSLVNPASGRCLADPRDSTATGTRVRAATCSSTDPGMVWRVR